MNDNSHMEETPSLWNGKTIQFWIDSLRDPEDDQRLRAVDALRHIAFPSQAVPLFLQIWNDRDWRVRALIVHSLYDLAHLQKHHPYLAEAIPQLSNTLFDEHLDVSLAAIYTLELLGPCAKAVLPQLTELTERQEDRLHKAAADAILVINKDGQGGHC